MIGDHWEEVPLETWQRLAGYAQMPSRDPAQDYYVLDDSVPLAPSARAALLRDLRSDFGADSAFYRDVAARLRRGERFAVERMLSGEDPRGVITGHRRDDSLWKNDLAHDLAIYEALFDAKWRSLRAQCPLTQDLPAAVARMVRDDDGIDLRALLAHAYRAARELPADDPRYAPKGLVYTQTPGDLAYLDAKTRLLQRIAINDYTLARRRTHQSVTSGRRRTQFSGGRLARVPHEYVRNWAEHAPQMAVRGTELERLARTLEVATSKDGERPLRSFCGSGAPFAVEAARRGHAHHEPAADDPCWTGSLLRQLMDMAVQPSGSLEEELWDDATLDAHMRRCETPPELRIPLREFRSMMAVVRDKFPTIAQREKQAQELYDRFVARFDVRDRPARAAPRPKATPLPPEKQRHLAYRDLMAMNIAAKNNFENTEKWIEGDALEAKLARLDAYTGTILRGFAKELRAVQPYIAYWSERWDEHKTRTGRAPESIEAIRQPGEPPRFIDAATQLHQRAYRSLQRHYDGLAGIVRRRDAETGEVRAYEKATRKRRRDLEEKT